MFALLALLKGKRMKQKQYHLNVYSKVVCIIFQEASTGNIGVCYVGYLYLGLTAPVLEPYRAFCWLYFALSIHEAQNTICNIYKGASAISYESYTLGLHIPVEGSQWESLRANNSQFG